MALITPNTIDGSGVAVTLGAGDQLQVNTGIVLRSTDAVGVVALFDGAAVTNAGAIISSGSDALRLGAVAPGQSLNFTLNNTGVILSSVDDAVQILGQNVTITNAGTIAGAWGIFQNNGDTGGTTSITNTGTITGWRFGIAIGGDDDVTIKNSGKIATSDTTAITTDSATMFIENSGDIDGNVALGSGDDTYKAVDRGKVFGDIQLGSGFDTVYGGVRGESIFGGVDTDTVIYSGTSGVRAALDGSVTGLGWAKGDTFSSIENLTGADKGNDTLIGNTADNYLRGRGGADSIQGGSGADSLFGGKGTDTLVGNAGADGFYFTSRSHFGDKISDFSGPDTIFLLDSVVDGTGITGINPTSGQFKVRATSNQAEDFNDFFIFRQSDRTLWFDANANDAGGPVLLADLQAGATLTRTDIVIYSLLL
jgi:Ca2+-binding RTX toxin-like protein